MNKVVIIVLVLIVVVFVIFVTRGSLTKDQPKRGKKSEAANYKAPDWTKTIKKAFAAVGKKVKLNCPPNVPPDKDFECKSLPLDNDINIPAETGSSFRVVTLVLIKGRANIEYDDNSQKADDYELDEQDFPLPNPDTDEHEVGSIVILEKGGRLRISCQGGNPCQVAQQ
jgi:hypothetical protein